MFWLEKLFYVINFRYHLVSLIAVFLALALGLVIGTTALNGPIADNLKDQVTALASRTSSSLRTRSTSLQDEVDTPDDFADRGRAAWWTSSSPAAGCCWSSPMPSGADVRRGRDRDVGSAGATVTGTVAAAPTSSPTRPAATSC